MAAHLNALGWAVAGYDHRGHGQSEGQRGGLKQSDDYLHDLAHMIDTTRAAYPGQKLVLLAHSLGGLIAARFRLSFGLAGGIGRPAPLGPPG